jgi:hypothetical protein
MIASMTRTLPIAVTLVALAVGACGFESPEPTRAAAPMPATLPGVYSGSFPCSNCAAIAATLWLRADGRFFLRQTFVDEAALGDQDSAFALGRWHWDETTAEAVLRGAGPERRLTALEQDRLRLQTASPVEHVLTRDSPEPAFTDRLRLDGESALVDRGAVFTECLTGLEWAVAETDAFKELRRQHRVMNPRGKVALTTVEGHLLPAAAGEPTSEALVVDRFVAIKPGVGC